MKSKFVACLFFFSILIANIYAQKQFTLCSPDGKLVVQVEAGQSINYSIINERDTILDKSPISMTFVDGTTFGKLSKLCGFSKRTVNETIEATAYKRKYVNDNYKELILKFREGFSIVFRAYDKGFAYRFVSELKKPIIVKEEEASFHFNYDNKIYIPYVSGENKLIDDQFVNSFENTYNYSCLSNWEKGRLAFLPIVIETKNGTKIGITEADLISYPGMFLYPDKTKYSLKGVFAGYPKVVEQGGYNMIQTKIKSRESFIAQYSLGNVKFPWRILTISKKDFELADNDMVYRLATPPMKDSDFSWVKPGKVAWDWWNDWNLFGVDFKTGVNNATYKYYIDFASKYGIPYVMLDDGWSTPNKADLFDIAPEINIKELVDYAKDKNVGIILWAGYYAFNKDLERVCKYYSEVGIKGFKVDFMDRDDQLMVDFLYNAAKITAKYKLLIDFHGTYKPTGLSRTFPNVLNNEGVYGLENLKIKKADVDQVTNDVTIPFIRMIAGRVDYTQGAMRNATKENFRGVYSEPMSQGTRCRQLAEYVVFESPLNMLSDSPSRYLQENECTTFIAKIPTVWDNTVSINGEISKYITIARKKGNEWYVGSMTNWDKRTLDLDLSFLGTGNFKAEIFKDGINADRIACDYKREIIDIPTDKKLQISMAQGGGYAMRIYPNEK